MTKVHAKLSVMCKFIHRSTVSRVILYDYTSEPGAHVENSFYVHLVVSARVFPLRLNYLVLAYN